MLLGTDLENRRPAERGVGGRERWSGMQLVCDEVLSVLGNGGFWFGFDGDVDFRALLETNGLAIGVVQRVFDANLLIQFVGPFDGNLNLFRRTRAMGTNDLFNDAGKRDGCFIRRFGLVVELAVHVLSSVVVL